MKKILSLLALLALGIGACQKQTTEADRQAEIEGQVQDRLTAERQADEQARLAQRQAELEAREEALAAQEKRAANAVSAAPTSAPAVATVHDESDAESGSYATFYRKLEPYGDWMETGDYGYVFQPRQAAQSSDWRPYTVGHWVYTDAGWTWISEEKFGWATYHYGRWIRLRSVGWVWVPGEQWAPAWVSWRKGNDYVGWAPLPPEAQFDRRTGIQHWVDNYYDIGPQQYTFVTVHQFGSKLSPREIVPPERNVTIINQTTNVTNIVYHNSVIVDRGPSYEDLRARSRQPIERYRLDRTQNLTDERPVFRGEVIALPTIDFRPAERSVRPNRITRNIAQPVVEHGWAGIKDRQAAEKARSKMKAEATPPANPPPRKFVRPEPRPANPPPSTPAPAATAVPSATPVPTPRARMTPVSTPPPISTPGPSRPSATPSPSERPTRPSATPQATRRPDRPGGKPRPTMTVAPTAPPNETATPQPPASAGPQTPASTPVPSVEPTPPQPVENIAPQPVDPVTRPKARADQAEKRKQRQERQAQRRAEIADRAKATPEAADAPEDVIDEATPAAESAATSPSPVATAKEEMRRKRQEKRAERKARQREKEKAANEDGQSDASPTPEAQQL